MAEKNDEFRKLTGLRREAEALLRAAKHDVAAMPVKEVQQLVHELQVHQIELEMQNDELRRAQVEIEAARDRYAELYDFSPSSHLTLDLHGNIVEANLRASLLLEMHRKELIRQPFAQFLATEDADTFHRYRQDVFRTRTAQTCEIRLRTAKGVVLWVCFKSLAVHEEPGPITQWRMALLDVTDRKLAELKLESQRVQFEAVVGSAMDAMITLDEGQRVVVFNRAAEQMFLCPAAEAMGQPIDRFIPERFRHAHPGHLRAFARTQATARSMGQPGTLFGLRADGEEFPIEASISHVQLDGKTLLTVILRDITERRRAEAALSASDAFTRAVLNSLSAQVCVLNNDGVILKTNDAWREFVREYDDGVFVRGEVGQPYLDVCRQAFVGGAPLDQAILDGIEAVLDGRETSFSAEYCVPSPEEAHWVLLRVTSLKGSAGVVLSHANDSARVRVAQALEQQVRLTGKLIEAQEQDRRRIARELHDDFNQRLAALSVELETMERGPVALPDLMVRRLAAIRGQVGRLSDDLHDLAYKLHPSLLDHVGLEVAIREHVEEFAKRTQVPVVYTPREVPGTLPPEIATTLFRIMQESLQNVSKHAQATGVTVRLSGSSKGVGLSVHDNGQGFDSDSRQEGRAGLGLVSMQERTRLLGGFFRIHSSSTSGTKVCAWIPSSQEGR